MAKNTELFRKNDCLQRTNRVPIKGWITACSTLNVYFKNKHHKKYSLEKYQNLYILSNINAMIPLNTDYL